MQASLYKVWYKAGALYIWFDGSLVYAQDVANGVALNTGDCIVTGDATGGLDIGTGAASIDTAVAIADFDTELTGIDQESSSCGEAGSSRASGPPAVLPADVLVRRGGQAGGDAELPGSGELPMRARWWQAMREGAGFLYI